MRSMILRRAAILVFGVMPLSATLSLDSCEWDGWSSWEYADEFFGQPYYDEDSWDL